MSSTESGVLSWKWSGSNFAWFRTPNDTEIKNRVNKVQYQHDQFAKGENLFGIKELSTYLGNVNLPAFDELKRVTDEVSKPIATGLTFLNGHEFTIKDFPNADA